MIEEGDFYSYFSKLFSVCTPCLITFNLVNLYTNVWLSFMLNFSNKALYYFWKVQMNGKIRHF